MFQSKAHLDSSGTLMIKDAEIKNFRCFKSVKLQNCKRVNVILGRNATGKTAIMEAIFLCLGPGPEPAQRLRMWRGLPSNVIASSMQVDWNQWSDLFYGFDRKNEPLISLQGTGDHNRTLKIRYPEGEGLAAIGGQISPGQPNLLATPLRFEFRKPNGSTSTVRAVPFSDQILYVGAETLRTEVVMFASFVNTNSQETVERFSTLVRERKEQALVEFVLSEFHFIKGMEVAASPLGGVPTIYLDIDGAQEKTPLGLVSGGVNKIISILTAIAVYKGGVIILDEIENGVYFDRYQALWGSIYRFAKDNDVQIFASTHSEECLRALAQVSDSGDWANEVSFVRTTEDSVGNRTAEQFHGATLFGAMKIGEIR